MKRFWPPAHNIFFLLCTAVLILLAAFLFAYKSFFQKNFSFAQKKTSGVTYIIILDKDGFSPPTMTIHRGDSVAFITKRGKPFWPASNLHPLHMDYAEFDPKRPIAPEESWSFGFDKTGKWGYHDHLYPFFAGIIQVLP